MIHSLCFKAAIRNLINVDWPKLHKHVSIVVVVLGIYVPPAAKVMQRQDLGLKSHPKDYQTHDPWFTRRVALPLHHGGFYHVNVMDLSVLHECHSPGAGANNPLRLKFLCKFKTFKSLRSFSV